MSAIVRITLDVAYGFHDVLSWDAGFHEMISELNVIYKVCADLALFSSNKILSVTIRRHELELTVGTLRIAFSVKMSKEHLFTYPRQIYG
jgi:hypothetical protein